MVALVKPQFEAGKEKVGKKGVVREAITHLEVLEKIATFSESIGFIVKDASYSPITGGEGNIEFLFHLYNPRAGEEIKSYTDFASLVKEAHQQLE